MKNRYANYPLIMERELEVAIRWTEVHVKKLLSYPHLHAELCENRFFELHNTYYIQVTFEFHCMNRDGIMSWCYHSECDRGMWVPVMNVYAELYRDDLILSIPFVMDNLKAIRDSLTFLYTHPPERCACGRLGKTHQLASENGKCNNCYIYGYVRGENCAICLADDGKPWVRTSCQHYFHEYCWFNMAKHHGTRRCPLCRSEHIQIEDV